MSGRSRPDGETLGALADGELEPARELELLRRLAEDGEAARELVRLLALNAALRQGDRGRLAAALGRAPP